MVAAKDEEVDDAQSALAFMGVVQRGCVRTETNLQEATPDLGTDLSYPDTQLIHLHCVICTALPLLPFNLPLGFLLWSIWLSQSVSSSFIIGLYFILTGIERFSEDAYRGEKQTRFRQGLRENQWIALGAVLIGICITMLPTSLSVSPIGTFDLAFFAAAVVGGVLTAFAMSMDFPKSTVRFSRLSG